MNDNYNIRLRSSQRMVCTAQSQIARACPASHTGWPCICCLIRKKYFYGKFAVSGFHTHTLTVMNAHACGCVNEERKHDGNALQVRGGSSSSITDKLLRSLQLWPIGIASSSASARRTIQTSKYCKL